VVAVLATIIAAVAAFFTAGMGLPGLIAAAAMVGKIVAGTISATAVALAVGGVVSGVVSMSRGHSFWLAFNQSVQDEFLDALIVSFAFVAVFTAISTVANAVKVGRENSWILIVV